MEAIFALHAGTESENGFAASYALGAKHFAHESLGETPDAAAEAIVKIIDRFSAENNRTIERILVIEDHVMPAVGGFDILHADKTGAVRAALKLKCGMGVKVA